jgi:hypothetical protein
MLEEQLKRIYALVGEITTEFNNVESLWYLIFTCLIHQIPRAAADAIFEQHKTGGGQRKLIRDVAAAVLLKNPDGTPGDLLNLVTRLCSATDEIAGRRNHVMHSLIYIADFSIPPKISAMGISKRSALANNKDVEGRLKNLLADIEYHGLDVEALRVQIIQWAAVARVDIAREWQLVEFHRQEVAKKHPRAP